MSKTETQSEAKDACVPKCTASDGKTEIFSAPWLPLMVRATDFNAMLSRLDAENKALRADAERYGWLRRWKGQEHEPLFTVQHEIDGTLWGGDLDAAIDAAMAAAKSGGAA